MARLLGPDPSTQLAIRVSRWSPVIPTTYSLALATIYTDEAATTPASIAEYSAGTPNTPGAVIPQSRIKLTGDSRFPLFWFPDGVDVVYAKMRDGEVFRLVADVDRRLDALGDGGGGVPDLTDEVNALDVRVDTVEGTLTSHGSRLTTAESDINALESADTALDGRLDTAEGTISSHTGTLTGHGNRLTTAEGTISSHTTSLTNLGNADTALDGRLDTAEGTLTSHTGTLTGHGNRLTTAEGTISSHTTSLTNLGNADTALDGRLDTAEGTLTSHGSRLTTAESDINALESADVALDGRLDTAEATITTLGSSVVSTGVVNVKDPLYGATGNGSTDDTAALQAALNAAAPVDSGNQWSTGRHVYLPPGTYLVGPLTIPQRVTLVGAGQRTTRIKLKANAGVNANLLTNQQNYSGVNDAQGVTIKDLWLDGNRPNQLANSWNSAIVLNNSTPSGTYQWTDGRHQVSNVFIESFTGNGFVQAGRGGSEISDVNVWNVGRFGFNIGIDCKYSNCEAGGTGLDGWLIQGNNLLSNCKAWYAGSSLVTGRSAGESSTTATVNPPSGGNNWDGTGVAGLVFSLPNGWGNGFHWAKIEGSAYEGNFNGGTAAGCCAQDNARAGFKIHGSRMTLSGCEADSNAAGGTSDGTSGGTPVSTAAGFELTAACQDNTIDGLSWDRIGTFARQTAALAVASGASRNRVDLAFRGSLLDGSNMPPLLAGSVVGANRVTFRSQATGGVNAVAYAASITPDPFLAELHTVTLTGNVTLANPAMTGTLTTGIFVVPGMRLTVQITQDATGGRTVTFGSQYRARGYAFDLAPSASSSITFVYDGTNWVAVGGSYGGRDSVTRAFVSASAPVRPLTAEYLATVHSSTGTGGGWTLGDVRYSPVNIPVPMTFSGLSTNISALGTGGTTPLFRMGVYADDGTGAAPLIGSGPIAGTEVSLDPTTGATGNRDVAFSGGNMTLPAGTYWLATQLTSGTAMTAVPTMVVTNAISTGRLTTLGNVSHRSLTQSASGSGSALPNAAATGTAGAQPIVALKVA